MYGLPKDFDGTFLIGKSLELVCFNLNQITLHFDARVIITIESALSYQSASNHNARMLSLPVTETDLMKLLGHSIKQAVGLNDGTLVLTFDNGDIVKCLDTSTDYESYQISFDGRNIIV